MPFALQVGPHAAQGPVPANLAWLIDRAIQPDPDRRHQTVQALIDDVQSTARGVFEVKCTYSFQQFVLAAVARWHDRHPALFTYVAVGGGLALFTAGALMGALGVVGFMLL